MPPFKRYWNWNRPRRRWRKRRFYTSTWRPRRSFPRRRRRRTVRKRFYKKFLRKKLKKIKLNQWQPTTIHKCHIKGFLPLFQCGDGRQENNYIQYKDSYTPENEPGGGGWSIQKLSLGILYKENKDFQNYWTKSNRRLVLCRYIGARIILYRQPYTDYLFHYFHDPPKNVTKYYFASFHPLQMLKLKHTVIVPSFNSQPHKRKPYKKLYIKPPKLLKNQWYFQQNFSDYPLIHMTASAISLTNSYGSDRAQNNNCSIWMLNTTFFQNPCTQFNRLPQPTFGYHPNKSNYYWALYKSPTNPKRKDAIYLGQSMLNEPGYPEQQHTAQSITGWGNPFYYQYLLGEEKTFITNATEDPATFMTAASLEKDIETTRLKETPNVFKVRYNPFKDKGSGNRIYFVPNFTLTHQTWDPPSDPDTIFEGFPLWLMFWGIEDILKKMGKCPNLYEDWVCVIQTNYFSTPEKFFVPLSESFVHGQGAYDIDRDHIPPAQYTKWFPKYKFQKEAIHNIVETAPFVCRPDHVKNFQAVMHYNFFFKWGGNPSPMEPVEDPNSQPITPYPPPQQLTDEITNPYTDLKSFIYPWDVRRDMLTDSAAKRIKDSTIDDFSLFTDQDKPSTDIELFKEAQTKTTPQKEKETLLLQLKQLQQYNKLLRQRFNKLNISLEDL